LRPSQNGGAEACLATGVETKEGVGRSFHGRHDCQREITLTSFRPKFDQKMAVKLAEAYEYDDDEPALRAGKAIAKGNFSPTHLKAIFEWKTGNRGKGRIDRNSDSEIGDALKLAASAKEPRSAISVLIGLHGIQVPVASAIMTAIKPDTYTIIDFRALEALGIRREDQVIDLNRYLRYLSFCIKQSAEWKMSLRDFDRALWQWSKNRSKKAKK
jgi:hypothetical protein